ncbi:MAG: YbaB/EbfC family nucleoid-associated protein [Acidobacteria bacterium]|nr:YbaB/EbfC family nucleoid-associated protein [Acidobacteriota bacterium]
MSNLFEQAQQLQSQLLGGQEAQAFEGVAGGGAVKVTVSGTGEFTGVTIRPDAVDPGDVAMLEDLVLAAVRDASAQVSAAMQQRLGGALGNLFGGSAG